MFQRGHALFDTAIEHKTSTMAYSVKKEKHKNKKKGSCQEKPAPRFYASQRSTCDTIDLLINWSTSESNTLLDPTTYLDYTDCWIQQVTAPTLVVTCWIQQPTCILHSSWTGGASPPCASRW